MIHRLIVPSSLQVHISGSDGLPPPVNMTHRTTSKCPRSANRTLKLDASALCAARPLSSRTSGFPSLRLRAPDPFLRCEPGPPLGGDFGGIKLVLGNTSVSGRRGGAGSTDDASFVGASSKFHPSASSIRTSSTGRPVSSLFA